METMNIALPKSMKTFVQSQLSKGGYSSSSEYVRDLIRAEQKRKAMERLEALVLEGLNSGPSTPMTRKDWERIRKEGLARAKARRRKKSP